MAPMLKTKRKSKPPARLKEFLCEDSIEKELEPRRSSRTPKISERLKRYMDNKGGVLKDQDEGQMSYQMKKEASITVSSGHHLLGSKYREPKVVLQALPKSLLQKGTRKYPTGKREARITLKRLGNSVGSKKSKRVHASKNSVGNKKSKRVFTSKLHKSRTGLTSSNSPQVSTGRKELKVEVEDISSSSGRSLQKRGGKRKRVNVGHDLQPKEKCSRMSPRVSEHKARDEKIKEKGDTRFDPDVMKKLFNFGAKVEEVLTLNKEAITKLTKDNKRARSVANTISNRLEEIDENDVDAVLKWLEEEERQRREHRERVLESLRVSHSTNIALYSHMLTVLQSVTTSV